jgi:uncharacterized Zn-binding protein involved in type VI secretion
MAAPALPGISTGHACFPPTQIASGLTTKTRINGMPIQTKGRTQYAPHNCGKTVHAGALRLISTGASKTNIEGNPVARIGDKITCGDYVGNTGSRNTNVE